MTTTLVLSTLVGTAAGIPLLRFFTHVNLKELEEKAQQWVIRLSKFLPVLAFLPFAVYSLSLALFIVLLAVALTNVIRMVTAISNPSKADERGTYSGFKNVGIFAASGIIVIEIALASANAGFFPSNHPWFCAWIGRERAVPALFFALKDDDAHVSNTARIELLKIGASTIPELLLLTNDSNKHIRRQSTSMIIELGQIQSIREKSPDPIQAFISILGYKTYDISPFGYDIKGIDFGRIAEEELMKYGEQTVPQLASALKRNNLQDIEYSSIFHILRSIPLNRLVPLLLKSFEGQANTLNFDLGAKLASFGAPAIPHLIKGLDSDDPWIRYWTKEALVRIEKPSIVPLRKVLANGSDNARAEAALALGQLQDRSAVPMLITVIKTSPPEVRDDAIRALGIIGDRDTAPFLISEYKKSPQALTLEAISNLRTPIAIPVMVEAFRSDTYEIRHAAFEGLKQAAWIGEKGNFGELIEKLDGGTFAEQNKAIILLERKGDYTVLPALERSDRYYHALQPSDTDFTKCNLCHAIKTIKSRQ